jgi:hypothetical protein
MPRQRGCSGRCKETLRSSAFSSFVKVTRSPFGNGFRGCPGRFGRWPVGPPLVDGFGNGLYEVRTGVDDDIYRVFFCNIQHTMVLLHGFKKKTQQTPKADLDLAQKRQKIVKEALS